MAQDEAIKLLEKYGFKVTHIFSDFPGSNQNNYCMVKKIKNGSYHAVIDFNGFVNGELLNNYLKNIKK